jgi:LPXTG-motif cell wall-anchored protein
VGREIPVTGTTVISLATGGIIAVAFGSGVLARRARAHRYHIYLAPN